MKVITNFKGDLDLEKTIRFQNKVHPQWWYVFLADLRVRTSRFRFLGKFRFALPFIMIVLFIIQFILVITSKFNTEFTDMFSFLLTEGAFMVETIIAAFVIFTAFNSSISFFGQNTTMEELELISGSPISTRSYLFGKYLSMQINYLIFVPFIMIAQVEVAKLAGMDINWFYLFFHFIVISVLFLSLSWLGLTLGPKVVFNIDKQRKGQKGARDIRSISLSMLVVFQFFIPIILAFLLTPEQFEIGFTYVPTGWYAKLAREIFFSRSIEIIPSVYGLLALLFGSLFLVVAYFRTNYSLNLENFEALTGGGSSNSKTPFVVKVIDKLPLPHKYSIKTFYLLSSRKNSLNRLVDIAFIIGLIGITIVGFLFEQYDWSKYVFLGAVVIGFILLTVSSTGGLQILFGGKNTFLVCQSAPNGIRKMLIGKIIQLLFSYTIEILSVAILLLIFHNSKLDALLLILVIICGAFNGVMTGVLSLSIAPFFETTDITSNPIRGLQIALPLNINMFLVGGIVIILVLIFQTIPFWLLFLILALIFVGLGIIYFIIAEKFLLRFQT